MSNAQKKKQAPRREEIVGKDLPARTFLNRNKCLKFYIHLICQTAPTLSNDRFFQQNAIVQ